jgi:hypothetical protein
MSTGLARQSCLTSLLCCFSSGGARDHSHRPRLSRSVHDLHRPLGTIRTLGVARPAGGTGGIIPFDALETLGVPLGGELTAK